MLLQYIGHSYQDKNKTKKCTKDAGINHKVVYERMIKFLLLTVTGFARKEIVDDRVANYGFQFKLTKVDGFTEAKNPREEAYEFNIWWLHTTSITIAK